MDDILNLLSSDQDAAVRLAQVLATAVRNRSPDQPGAQTSANPEQSELTARDADPGAKRVQPTGVSGVSASLPTREVGGSDSALARDETVQRRQKVQPASQSLADLANSQPHALHEWQTLGKNDPTMMSKRKADDVTGSAPKRLYSSARGRNRSGSEHESAYSADDSESDSDSEYYETDEPASSEDEGARKGADHTDFDPCEEDVPAGSRTHPTMVAYLRKHARSRLDRDARKRLVAKCPRPKDVPELATPKCDHFIKKPKKGNKNDHDQLLYSIQDEVLDAFGPLSALYSNALEAQQQQSVLAPSDVLHAVQQTVVLLGHASEHISRERRYALLKRHEPSAIPVLQGPLHITGDTLFGPEFLEKMKTQAEESKAFRELSSASKRKRSSSHPRRSESHGSGSGSSHRQSRSYNDRPSQPLFREAPDFSHPPGNRSSSRGRGHSRGAHSQKHHQSQGRKSSYHNQY